MRTLFASLLLLALPSVSLAQPAPPAAPPPAAPPPAEEKAPEESAISASLVVKVPQVEPATEALITRTRELGGWFASRQSDHVDLRVPAAKVGDLLAFVTPMGTVVENNFGRQDMSFQLSEVRSRLKAREDMLQKYFEVLQAASADSVLTVEQQTASLVAEVEQLKGQLQVLEDQVAWARVSVSFQFRERNAPSRDGTSSFAWLNSMNLQDLLWDFGNVRTPTRARRVQVTFPEGFARFRQRSAERAASPDGVLLRVRTTRHKPRADLAFWKEALKNRMTEAGYRFLSEEDLEGGYLLELMAPMGTEDWSYLVAVVPKGRRLVIVEAAGEAARFQGRRDKVMEAVRTVR